MNEFYQQIGKKISELRLKYPKGEMSQDAVAEQLGIASNTVSRWETGTYKPTPEDLDSWLAFRSLNHCVFYRTPTRRFQGINAGVRDRRPE